jgi:exopolyphosphatase / guanosine-5'-triphosphate,3'-diphosphate pyrophosphatase
MSVAAVFLQLDPGTGSTGHRSVDVGRTAPTLEARSAGLSEIPGYDEVVVVVTDQGAADSFPEGVTVLLDESAAGESGALHAALDWCARRGHAAVVVARVGRAFDHEPHLERAVWRALLPEARLPIVVAATSRGRAPMFRLDASVWSLVPLEGSIDVLLASKSELVEEQLVDPEEPPVADVGSGTSAVATDEWASMEDVVAVEALLGRSVAARFSVVVRDDAGLPVVIRNAPLLDDGTPMPTRFWLVGRRERELVGRLESSGGVDAAEAAVDPVALSAAHDRYAAERDAALPKGHSGPVPHGGVGGTREGVKCLHAHLAWYLAGGPDPVGRWVASKLKGELRGAVAAIDCGTNSTRLLIADRSGATVLREMTVTRLGEGVDETHRLASGAIERTLSTLRRYREEMDTSGVVALRITATSAARDATNSSEFFDAAEAVLGVRPELLAGEEEGALSYAGATMGLPPDEGPFLVCDLGGGSTELVAGGREPGSIAGVSSMDVGCVRISERFLTSDPPSTGELAAARAYVRAAIEAATSEAPALTQPRSLVGVAGTVSTLVALRRGVTSYDRDALHHQRLEREDVAELLSELASSPLARRRAIPGIEPGRADVIVGGALVLLEVMDALGHDHLVYSEDDILDGLVASLREPRRQTA